MTIATITAHDEIKAIMNFILAQRVGKFSFARGQDDRAYLLRLGSAENAPTGITLAFRFSRSISRFVLQFVSFF